MRCPRGGSSPDWVGRGLIGVSQARISDIGHAQEMQVTTLAKYIAGLGGTLHVQAVFPDEVCDLTA